LGTIEKVICSLYGKNSVGSDPFDKVLDETGRAENVVRLGHRLGRRYARCTFANYEVTDEQKQRPIVNRLREFAARMPDLLRGGGGLMLFGNPGTGKDHLVAALLKVAIVKHGLSAAWYDGGELFDLLYFALREESPAELKALIRLLREPHILAISDPQPPRGELSDSQVRRLRDVIDKRYRAGLSTWITTNIDQRADAEALLTGPMMDRLRESAGKIYCDWPSYREGRQAGW